MLEVVHLRVTGAHVVQQPAGRGHDDVHATLERVLLRPHAHAAEHRRAGDRRVHRERGQILENLRGELARRRQDERPGRAPRLVDQTMDDRKKKGRRFAAAGLRGGDDVLALHRRGNRLSLNRRRSNEAEFLDAPEQRGVKAEMVELHGSLWLRAQDSRLREALQIKKTRGSV